MLYVHYSNTDHTPRQQPVVQQSVNFMRWSTLGWCDKAEVTAISDYRDIGGLINMLRSPVEIYDEHGTLIWWGVMWSLSYLRGSIRVTYSLDSISNKVAVAYSWVEPGTNLVGIRKTTAYSSDSDSIGFFGTKELLISKSGLTDAAAIQIRDNELKKRKYIRMSTSGDGGGAAPVVECNPTVAITIGLMGWVHTLDWLHVAVPLASYIDYSGATASNINIGDVSGRPYGKQSFTIATNAVTIVKVRLGLLKVGAPTDNLVVGMYATDASGNPTGSAVASANVAGSSLTTSVVGYDIDLGADVSAQPGVYAIQVSRSGAVDGSNYYQVYGYAATGYSGGDWKIYNGTSWGADGSILDIRFVIYTNNLAETTQQIKEHIISAGQFLNTGNVIVTDASGIFTGSQRDGDTTALAEILDHFDSGYSDGARMVIKIGKARETEIYKASATPVYKANSYNQIYSVQTDEPIRPYMPPIGTWVVLTDLLPETADTARLITPGLQYMIAYEWREGNTTPIYESQDELGGALEV
jgi:hypothetical protein